MRPVHVTAFSQARASAPSVVDFDPRHEVILLCSEAGRVEAASLAETLLALGFDALVLSGTPPELAADLEEHGYGARPALLVGTDVNSAGPVLRSRVTRVLSRPHSWLRGEPASGMPELQRRICAQMDAFERDQASASSIEPVVVEEVSNVVLLPVPSNPAGAPPDGVSVPPSAAPNPPEPIRSPANPVPALRQAKKLSRVQIVLWPLGGAAVMALGLALVSGPSSESARPDLDAADVSTPVAAAAPKAVTPEEAVQAAPMRAAVPPAPVSHAAGDPTAASPRPVPAPVPVPEDPLAAVIAHERVVATDGWLIYEAPPRARDWYAAMNLCRGRSHAGIDGWSTPSSKLLNALAKQRVLPEGSLWSRTRAMRAEDVAFVVHGRAGTARQAIKTETIDAAVCVRRRTPAP